MWESDREGGRKKVGYVVDSHTFSSLLTNTGFSEEDGQGRGRGGGREEGVGEDEHGGEGRGRGTDEDGDEHRAVGGEGGREGGRPE